MARQSNSRLSPLWLLVWLIVMWVQRAPKTMHMWSVGIHNIGLLMVVLSSNHQKFIPCCFMELLKASKKHNRHLLQGSTTCGPPAVVKLQIPSRLHVSLAVYLHETHRFTTSCHYREPVALYRILLDLVMFFVTMCCIVRCNLFVVNHFRQKSQLTAVSFKGISRHKVISV